MAPPPTPTPRPTPTPKPLHQYDPNIFGNGCLGQERFSTGPLPMDKTKVDQPADIKLVSWFQNPRRPERKPWEAPKAAPFTYGFMLRDIQDKERGWSLGLLVTVNSNIEWTVQLRGDRFSAHPPYGHGRQRLHVLDSGSLASVPFNTGPEEYNHLMFSAKGNTYAFAVNGHRIPLDIDQADLDAVERHIGRYRYHDTGQWHGYFNITNPKHPQPPGTYLYRDEVTTGRQAGTWVWSTGLLRWEACVP